MNEVVSMTFDVLDDMEKVNTLQVRQDQNDLMLDIAETIYNQQVLMSEAGVGIGKSYAYLIPGLLQSILKNNGPLVISTSSIQLTDQLEKDVKDVSQLLKRNYSVIVGKGRTNYPCFQRYQRLNKKALNDDMEKSWKEDSRNNQRNYWVEKCTHQRCNFHSNCEFHNMRQALKGYKDNDCIIVNHNLLIEDLKKKRDYQKALISNAHTLIIDEAHKFEEVVRDSLSESFNLKVIERIEHLQSTINYKEGKPLKAIKYLNKIIKNLHEFILEENKENLEDILNSRLNLDPFSRVFNKEIMKLVIELENVIGDLRYFNYNDNFEDAYEDFNELLIKNLKIFKGLINNEVLIWGIYNKRIEERYLSIVTSPKRIDFELKDLLFDPVLKGYSVAESLIFLSATLGSGQSEDVEEYYRYQRQSLGLPKETIYSEPKFSPFNYYKQSILYTPKERIDIKDFANTNKIALEIIKLANLTQGRTIVLFTSKKQLLEIYKELLRLKDMFTWEILKQSENVETTISDFREKKGVLLATGAFWEGINIPGSDLSSLIIVRLPYPVPDPVFEYKNSLNKGTYRSEMLIKLKQGSGRLIRKEDDVGILSIIDGRLDCSIIKELPYTNLTDEFETVSSFWHDRIQ